MGSHLEVQLVNPDISTPSLGVSVGNDEWVCDHRRGNPTPPKNKKTWNLGGSSHPSPKPKIPRVSGCMDGGIKHIVVSN
jgi:hypothetical protein